MKRLELGEDEGTSMIDLVVGMLIMTMFMAMFTSAVLLMNQAENKAEAVNLTSTQVSLVFTELDKVVRYAAAVASPGTGTTGDWYVEMRTTNTGREVCTQLRVDITLQQLQRRTWTVTNSTASNLTSWSQVAPSITNGGATSGSSDQPFVLESTTSAVLFQQLTVNLVSIYGTGTTMTTSRSSFTTNAVNSTVPPPSSVCAQVGRP